MRKRLTTVETKRAIRKLGIEWLSGATFGLFDAAKNVRYAYHRHTRHQLIFPASGMLFVETKSAYYACSPELGLWIPAGVRHATTTGLSETISVFFHGAAYPGFCDGPTIVRITPLLRETAKHAATDKGGSGYSTGLFQVVHGVVAENMLNSEWPSLPVGRSESMRRTIDVAMGVLSSINIPNLAGQSGQSERTLRRKFMEELGIGPELFLQRARLMRAMQLLIADEERTITEVAMEVGYSNHSAFSAAFRRFTGRTPRAFRLSGARKRD